MDLYADGDRWTADPVAGAELLAEGWLLPGLVDAHTHPGADAPGKPLEESLLREDLRQHVAAGVTMIRAPGLAGDPPAWFGRDGDVPRAVHAGPWIAQHGQFFDGWGRRADHAELAGLAAAQAARTGWAKVIADWLPGDDPLPAKGLTHGEIVAHLAEVYGAEVSKQTITTITDRVMEGMAEWQSRPLDPVYAVLFIDAINVKIREGQVANRPVYLALGVTVDGERDILGLWAGEHGDGEGAKFWLRVLAEIKNRGVRDVCLVVCDGLKGLPDAVSTVWEKTIVQTCIVHLLRNSFKYASKRYWAEIAKDLKPIYTAASEAEALDRFAEFSGKWENRYPAIIRLWENAWAEFVPFLRFDREIRTVICTTNAIESINARLRRAVNARGHFPTEQAALKCLYLAIMSLDPTGKGRQRWTNRWKAALNAFDIT